MACPRDLMSAHREEALVVAYAEPVAGLELSKELKAKKEVEV